MCCLVISGATLKYKYIYSITKTWASLARCRFSPRYLPHLELVMKIESFMWTCTHIRLVTAASNAPSLTSRPPAEVRRSTALETKQSRWLNRPVFPKPSPSQSACEALITGAGSWGVCTPSASGKGSLHSVLLLSRPLCNCAVQVFRNNACHAVTFPWRQA